MAMQLIADLYGCNSKILNNEMEIKRIAEAAVHQIGAEIVRECIHNFEPIGITYFAIISTSHISIHTWPENGYAAIDVFSCSEMVVKSLTEQLKCAFSASSMKTSMIERQVIFDESAQ